jgi:peptidoglycan/LPS O-acetylase OafA/YrhL
LKSSLYPYFYTVRITYFIKHFSRTRHQILFLLNEILNKHLQSARPYYPALDGLRGFAIILVLLYHNFDFIRIFENAWIGVDLFFVLSGFLITEILTREKTFENFLRNFYIRRVLRIFPIYYLSLIVFLYVLPYLINYQFSIHFFLVNQKWFWVYMQNWFFIFTKQENNNFLNHFWSLALEEQFYLVWPFTILILKFPNRIISFLLTILCVLLVARIFLWTLHFNGLSYISLYRFSRIDSLCIGSLLAALRFNNGKSFNNYDKLLIALFLISIFVILPGIRQVFHLHLPYLACCFYPGIALFFGFFVKSCLNPLSAFSKIFNIGVLRFFGKLSYGLYLYHWPIYLLLKDRIANWFKPQLIPPLESSLLISAITTAIAIFVAVISYYCIEVKFLKLKRFLIKPEIALH